MKYGPHTVDWLVVNDNVSASFFSLLWLRGRMITLDRMLDEGNIELLDKLGIQTEILNHAPVEVKYCLTLHMLLQTEWRL